MVRSAVILVFLLAVFSACKTVEEKDKNIQKGPEYTETGSGLKYLELKEGIGEKPRYGQTVFIKIVGKLEDGKEFENSYNTDDLIEFVYGEGIPIRGVEEGVATMKPGGKRRLVIPPDLAYGRRGVGEKIPPNATLIIDVELVKVQ